jgi:hypothetical protein
MPAVYATPGDGSPIKTRYMTLKGDKTMMPGGPKGIQMRTITDGTSMTLLFVRTAPEQAVEWTKPADLDYDADKPFTGLDTPDGMFLAALCDGSVHRISLAIAKDVMQALATRNGEEPIQWDSFNVPPGPHDYSADGEDKDEAVEVDEEAGVEGAIPASP